MMTTEKLYYQDQYIRSFSGKIQKYDKGENGRFYVVLDQTAFYPTGGGQPHDTGTLNGIQVIDVEELDGEIRHYLEQPIVATGDCVGEIDWERRFDHMQQHAGQHILSAAFDNIFHYKTVSFHLGKEICTIDLETTNLTEEEASQAEKTANTMILENRPMEARWVSENELAHYSLRKGLSVSENIRLVIVPEYDYNGCGGTHPASTGQVGAVKILHWEKDKKNIRVSFVCGNRVLEQLHEKHQVVQSLMAILSSPQEQLMDAAKRVLQQTKDLEKTIDDLKTQLIEYEANKLMDQAQGSENKRLVKAIFTNRPMSELQQLGKYIAANASNTIVLLVNENEEKFQIVCAKSKDLPNNMNQLLKQILPTINGKGGGSDSVAQGGGDKTVSAEELMTKLMDLVNTI
ncbi:alanyl-tRNA editing protein [Schinkia sp. CFF1]